MTQAEVEKKLAAYNWTRDRIANDQGISHEYKVELLAAVDRLIAELTSTQGGTPHGQARV